MALAAPCVARPKVFAPDARNVVTPPHADPFNRHQVRQNNRWPATAAALATRWGVDISELPRFFRDSMLRKTQTEGGKS